MTKEIPVAPIPGYNPMTETTLKDMTRLKHVEERALREIEDLELSGDYDARWLAIAKTHIQQGFMAMGRSIMRPSRIALPEDEEQEDEET